MCLAIPGKVAELFDEHGVRMARVDFGGVIKRACVENVPDARVGDYVLVHVGYALSKVDEAQAAIVFDFLKSMEDLDELKPDQLGAPA
jgi:hydrogenase expression/formation protein HypC